MGFADGVDAALQGLRVVLGSGDPPAPPMPAGLSPLPTWPAAWTGVLSDAAQTTSTTLDRTRTRIFWDRSAAVPVIVNAGKLTTGARSRLDAVQAQWERDKAQYEPIKETVLGQIGLTQAGQQRLADAAAVIRETMTAFEKAAQQLQMITADLPAAAPGQAVAPPSMTNLLLPEGPVAPDPAEGADAEVTGQSDGQANDGVVTKGDAALSAAGVIAGGTADGVRQAVANAIASSPGTGPGKADPGLLQWLEDPKVGGVEVKGLSRLGGVVAVASAVPAVMSDVHDGNSVAEAVTREAGGTAVGLVAGGVIGGIAADAAAGAAIGSVIPGAGTAVGLVVGAVVGGAAALGTSKFIDWLWD